MYKADRLTEKDRNNADARTAPNTQRSSHRSFARGETQIRGLLWRLSSEHDASGAVTRPSCRLATLHSLGSQTLRFCRFTY